MQRLSAAARDLNLSLSTFRERYARRHEEGEGPFANATFLTDPDDWEWKRLFQLQRGRLCLLALCCPEDVEHCGGAHGRHIICERCRFPICSTCRPSMQRRNAKRCCVPMTLCNDNMWGYSTDLIVKHKVRWIEAAALRGAGGRP